MVKASASEALRKALTDVGYELKVFNFEPDLLGMKLVCKLENGLSIVKVLDNLHDSQAMVLGVPVGSIIMQINGEDATQMKSLAEINRAIAVEIEGCKLLGKVLEITMMVPLPKELAEKFLRDELARELPPSARPGTATSRLGGDADLPTRVGSVLGLPAPLTIVRPACVPPIGTGLGVRYRRQLEEEQLRARADVRVAKMEAIYERLHLNEPSDVEAATRTFELHDGPSGSNHGAAHGTQPTSPPAKPPRASLWMSILCASLWTSKVEKKAAVAAKKAEKESAMAAAAYNNAEKKASAAAQKAAQKAAKKAAKKTEEEKAARKGTSGGNSVAPLGQPPATHAQLDIQQQLAEAIRQRQQRDGLVVVPWETISFTQTTLAKGAFGTVALATLSRELGRMQCAVKIADVRSGDGLGEALALLNEGSFMKINHPNIVKMFGITFNAPAKIGLIMELMKCSLHELIHAQALSGARRYVTWADSLLAIATDIAFGMTFLHYHNLIHRDLKPLNVLLNDGWMAKVADFGEMKRVEGGGDADARAAGSGRIHGTPSYVSPEAASVSIPDAPRVGTPTDVWSFGCLLAHCAARAAPYTDVEYLGRGLKPQEVVQWLLDGRANPLSMVVEGQNMPALLMDMARECTRVVPEQRPTFAHLAARLSTPTFIREICFKDAVIDEDEEEDLEARRPPVKLIVPTTEVLKDPSNARFREELSRGSSAKPEAEAHACVIS